VKVRAGGYVIAIMRRRAKRAGLLFQEVVSAVTQELRGKNAADRNLVKTKDTGFKSKGGETLSMERPLWPRGNARGL